MYRVAYTTFFAMNVIKIRQKSDILQFTLCKHLIYQHVIAKSASIVVCSKLNALLVLFDRFHKTASKSCTEILE